ncbi:MAG TPA: AraC family transcriptional regulator [Chryseolinea sp.]|nr:AraC family transcriptional regulator [Chryseolinea sp.]
MLNYYDTVKSKPEIFKQLCCKDLLFVNYNCPLETNKQDKWSHLNYILYVVTGKYVMRAEKTDQIASRSMSLNPGDAVFVKKGACVIEKFFDETLCLLAFFIPDQYLCSFLSENPGLLQKRLSPNVPDDLIIPLDANEIMARYYESLMPHFDSEIKPSEDLLELKFRELLFNIISNPANRELNGYLQALLQPQGNNLHKIIEANCLYNLKLEAYAKLCNRSLSSFKRDFYKIYGTAPANWLLNKRLQYAMQLLLNSDKQINDISFESGFENSTHFARVFKKQYGSAPLRYRLQTR